MFQSLSWHATLNRLAFACFVMGGVLFGPGMDPARSQNETSDTAMEGLPEDVVATMEARDRWFAALPPGEGGEAFFVEDLQRWTPGQTVRVAFLGGDNQLHKDIADATKSITDACNLKLDFGFDAQTGSFRKWKTTDTTHAAEIRVSFDQSGFFSLVGRDSVTTSIGSPLGPVGGRANQRSLNLGGFQIQRPASWKRTVRHEFLHALAFHHEHQSPSGGCDAQFRWEDDPNYQLTQDDDGQFIPDAEGDRPGIYAFLSGSPNFWSRAKVDHNLRQSSPGVGTAGTFDQASIMLYRFPALFYKTNPSPCAPLGGGEDLSPGDIAGLLHLYPQEEVELAEVISTQEKIFSAIEESEILNATQKSQYREMLDVRPK